MKPCRARGRTTHIAGSMNKLEMSYRDSLAMMKMAGEIHDFRFEALKLRLADRTTYSPDFLVIRNDGSVELHEVKGFWEDDARVKIKVAAELFPWFQFKAYSRKAALWIEEAF